MQFRCDETNITGVFSPYPGMEETTLDINEIPCLSDCSCDTEYYDPVCLDGKTYFSPCYAGCTQRSRGFTFRIGNGRLEWFSYTVLIAYCFGSNLLSQRDVLK